MRLLPSHSPLSVAGSAAFALALQFNSARAQTYSIEHQFSNSTFTDPSGPSGKLFLGKDGNLLGSTEFGGENGNGTVFSLSEDGVFTLLASVSHATSDIGPYGGVIADKNGNTFGTTRYTLFGFGADQIQRSVYIDPTLGPQAMNAGGLAFSVDHDLVGASYTGGAFGRGAVFVQKGGHRLSILHSFGSGEDGAQPSYGGLTADPAGNIYGATSAGGVGGEGVLYKLSASGAETIIHSFGTAENECLEPNSGLLLDKGGDIFGTTYDGGGGHGCVFEVTAAGVYKVLHVFPFSEKYPSSTDGLYPNGGLSRDAHGNLYGTTPIGGASGVGVVFKVSPTGRETILHAFSSGSDGDNPSAGVTVVPSGKIFGVAGGGTTGYGLVFSIAP